MIRKNYTKRRRPGFRRLKNVVLIICEGEKTEPCYFRGFRVRYSNLEIVPIHPKFTDPNNLIRQAKKEKGKYEINLKNGDSAWCVFDVDDRDDSDISNAMEVAEKNGIKIALSNPCIEFWFLSHYEYKQGYITREEAFRELRNHIPKYDKNICINSELEDKLEFAIENAKKLNKKHENDGNKIFSTQSNPSSQIYQLIEFIQETTLRNQKLLTN